MSRKALITKDVLLKASLEIVRKDGFQALSARNVAKQVGCSTRPIYDAYGNMEVFRQDLIAKIINEIDSLIYAFRKTEKAFVDLGMGYVKMAHTEPVLFRAFYSENITGVRLNELKLDPAVISALKEDLKNPSIPDERIAGMAASAWIYVHGLASFVASGRLIYNEEEVALRLMGVWNGILKECDAKPMQTK